MNNSVQLRDYQLSMLQDLYKAWKRNKSVMVQMPTGTGKTHLLVQVIRDQIASPLTLSSEGSEGRGAAGARVLVVAHRRELIEQISQTLDGFGVEHGLIVSGKGIDYGLKVQVASIQTLTRRLKTTDCTEDADIYSGNILPQIDNKFHFSHIIIDEAHHALAKTYRMLWEEWPKARFLGLTATPCRLNNAPFTDLFDKLLQSWSIQEFIDKGWLSDFDYVSASPDSEAMRKIRQLKKRGADGDYQTAEMATVMDVPESIEHLYKTYRQFADGKRGIVYAIDRQHARHIAEYYRGQGVRCAVIDAKTPAVERKRIIEEYKESRPRPPVETHPHPPVETHPQPLPIGRGVYSIVSGIVSGFVCGFVSGRGKYSPPYREGLGVGLQGGGSVLINVDIFSEGFDCPEVEFIQLARPTLSLSKYLQQVGRGMRVSPGKPHVLILDQVGLYQTFGLPTEERDWRRTFYGQASGRGTTDGSRLVVLDDPAVGNPQERELVNLQMVRIKKGGRRGAGLEIFLKDGRYGIRNNGRVSCPARFKEIVRLRDQGGYFAAGIYAGKYQGCNVEYASLIDRKGVDQNLRLFRDVYWKDGVYYSCYKPKNYEKGDWFWFVYWDPKGNCYYDENPEFHKVAGVEVAEAYEHDGNTEHRCHKLRYNTGKLSPRFYLDDMFFNMHIIIARDYLIVKHDRNHAYRICGYLDDTIIVQKEDMSGYQQILLNGKKGESFRGLPKGMTRISPISYIYYQKTLGLQNLWGKHHSYW